MKRLVTTDKANQPFGFVQPDGAGNIPSTITVQGTASYAAAAGSALTANSAGSAISASFAQASISSSYAANGTQWLNVSGGIAYRAGDVTIGGIISYPGLTVKVYQPTVGFANSEVEMDAVIADSPLHDNFTTPDVNAVSYSTYTGINQDYYAMLIEGYIEVPSDTTYWFGLDSDDASDAFIDNIKVSDLYGANGGYGNPFASNRYPIALTAGKHSIKVRFQEFGGGDFVTLYWSLNNSTYNIVPSSWFTYGDLSTSELTVKNDINLGDNSVLQSVPSSSGDGLNASTLVLKPDASLGTDQYIVLDPTANGHIHIRPGGDIDQSSADLILGGENTNVTIGYSGNVAITGSYLSFNGVIGDLRPYKVYTALLTQSGVSNYIYINSSPLTIGVTYEIAHNQNNDADFTNVGAPNNNIGTYFVATGTTPNSWGTGTVDLRYDEGAPIVTVLENTIGNIWFVYNNIGTYKILSDGLFTDNKTFITNGTVLGNVIFNRLIADDGSVFSAQVGYFIGYTDNATITLKSLADVETLSDSILTGLIPIEIRVYN